jgi:hypothetical protein
MAGGDLGGRCADHRRRREHRVEITSRSARVVREGHGSSADQEHVSTDIPARELI